MKKFGVIAAAVLTAAITLTGCGTTKVKGSGIKGNSATMKKTYREISDYSGSILGKEVPKWVELVMEGQYTQTALSPVMPDIKGKKIFVVSARGDNLDFVKTWTDQVDVEVQVAGQMKRVATRVAETHMKGAAAAKGTEADPTEVSRAIDQATKCATSVSLSGLEKMADYWLLVGEYSDKNKTQLTKEYYEYYTVWAMDEKIYNDQLKTAVQEIDVPDAAALRQALTNSMINTAGVSNDPAANEEALEAVVSFN